MEENKRRRNTIKRKLVNHETKTKENKMKRNENKAKSKQNKKPTRKQNVTKRKQNENYIEEFKLQKMYSVYNIYFFNISFVNFIIMWSYLDKTTLISLLY